MMVLKNVRGEWRLFWVLEVIGLSFGLAVLVVKVTGSDGVIDNQDEESRCTKALEGIGCEIYEWSFILNSHPMAVTVCALLLTSVISRPSSCLATCLLSDVCSFRNLDFMALLFLWFGGSLFGSYILGSRVLVYAISTTFVVVYVGVNHRAVKLAFAGTRERLRAADRRRRTFWEWGSFCSF